MIPRFARNLFIAFLFGLIWASIQYTQGRITDLRVLAINIVVFMIFGGLLILGVQTLVDWYRRRQ